MKIKLTNNEIIKVHKVKLAKNEVFKAMLDSQMIETQKNWIDITDCDPKAFKDFLHYLYTDDYLDEISLDLLKIAEKYLDLQLKEFCLDKLCNQISMDNIFETAQVAMQYNFEKLLKACQKFVVDNYTELIGAPQLDAILVNKPFVTGIIKDYREERDAAAKSWCFLLSYWERFFMN